MSKTLIDKKIRWIMYEPCDAKFLIIAAERDKVVEINHFGSFKDAKQVFDEIASDQVIMAASLKLQISPVTMTFQYGDGQKTDM